MISNNNEERPVLLDVKCVPIPLAPSWTIEGVAKNKNIDASRKKLVEQTFSEQLFTWKEFEYQLPPTIWEGEQLRNWEMFKDPASDTELRELAIDPSTNKLRKLSPEHLIQIRKNGSFDIPSIACPGQSHTWRLNSMLSIGTSTIHDNLRTSYAHSLNQLIIQIPNRLWRSSDDSPVNLRSACSFMGKGIKGVFSLLLGCPETDPANSESDILSKISNESKMYMLRNTKPSENSPPIDATEKIPVPDFITTSTQEESSSKDETKLSLLESQELHLDTSLPSSFDMDLRVWKLNLQELEDIWNNHVQAWRVEKLKLVKELEAQLQNNPNSDDEQSMAQIVVDTCNQRELNALFERIRTDKALNQKYPQLGDRIVEYLTCLQIIVQIYRDIHQEYDDMKQQYVEDLKRNYPIRSKLPVWIDRQVESYMTKHYGSNHQQTMLDMVFQRSYDKIKDTKFLTHLYLMKEYGMFKKYQEPKLRKALEAETVPAWQTQFNRRIWLPKHWKITKHGNYSYSLSQHTSYQVNSNGWFWRIKAWFRLTHISLSNGIFLLFVSLVYGPLSLQALFRPSKFYPDKKFDSTTGQLSPDTNNGVNTLTSRLKNIVESCQDSIQKFENTPDLGLLGKNVARVFNRIWNYFFKVLIGSTLVIVFQPLLTLLNTLVCILLIVTSVIWAPLFSTAAWLFNALIWDFFSPGRYMPRLFPLFRLLLDQFLTRGLLHFLLNILLAFVVHPLAALFIFLGGTFARGLRYFYDTFIHYLILKPLARMPVTDTFVCRRIAGPGIASNTYFQITPDEAILAFYSYLESVELDLFAGKIREKINEPQTRLNEFCEQVFTPLGFVITGNSFLAEQVRHNTSTLEDKLQKAIAERRRLLPYNNNKMLKQTKIDLLETITRARSLAQNFFTNGILRELNDEDLDNFWSNQPAELRDWNEKTKQLLGNVFGTEFLTPLEDTDKYLRLEVSKISVKKFVGMVQKADMRDELERVSASLMLDNKSVKPRFVMLDASHVLGLRGYISPANFVEDAVLPFSVHTDLKKIRKQLWKTPVPSLDE